MKPHIHAQNSANKFGGEWQDYMPVHDLIDSSKSAYCGLAHRAIFHSAFGIFIVEKILGPVLINSEAKKISVREIAENHVFEDLGFIPSLEDWMKHLEVQNWMHGMAAEAKRKKKNKNLGEVFKKVEEIMETKTETYD